MGKRNIVIQHDMKDCGVACMLMVLRYYDIDASYSEIRKKVNYNSEGISLKDLAEVSRQYGLDTKAYRCDSRNIIELNQRIFYPCIALVYNEARMAHYVVVYGCRNGKVILADPALGERRVPVAEFGKLWSGYMMTFLQLDSSKKGSRKIVDKLKKYNDKVVIIKKYRYSLLVVLLLSIVGAGLGAVFSVFLKCIVDKVVPAENESFLVQLTFVFMTLVIVEAWLGYIRSKAINIVDASIGQNIMTDFICQIFKLPISFFSTREDGDIVTRIKDIEKVKSFYVNILFSYSYNIIIILISATVILKYNKMLLVVTIVPCAFLLWVAKRASEKMRGMAAAYINKNSAVMASLLDEVRNISLIKIFSKERLFQEKNCKSVCELYDRYLMYVNQVGKYNSIIKLIKGISNIVLLSVGAYLVLLEEMSVGTLVLCNSLVMYLWEPIANIASLQSSVAMGKIAYERLQDMFEEEMEAIKEVDKEGGKIEGKIEFRNIDFSYHDKKSLLENVNFVINPHSITTLIGSSGSGKSSIAKMLIRLFEPKNGFILVDDKSYLDMEISELRRNIVYVEQDTKLFNMSIYDNLKLFNDRISDQELWLLCQKTGLDAALNNLPHGWHTIVMEGAVNLSGGQKQLIALVRALAQKPKVLLLDELTNGMDCSIEKRVMNLLRDLKKDMTIFLITHKKAVVQYSDYVYKIEKGEVISE